ncbi:hypothetical protein BIW59_25900 [Salmonella enterica]|nr:hypothetical protein [Salmonella enterica]EAS2061964.1 hypothetical protein [Salmonella enterica]EBN5433787.1 hypothetical protein [Salmonella enterica]EBQ5236348.1 hypothetical protein [Salmonella enterica]ECT9481811.1 hypothetical protein [Salmonella enterica subsp. enterica serovar Montevideo]
MLFAKCAPGDIISAARCRVISSGQSHQLVTGAVKKPTSPVGFFTSEVCRLAPGIKKSTWIGALVVVGWYSFTQAAWSLSLTKLSKSILDSFVGRYCADKSTSRRWQYSMLSFSLERYVLKNGNIRSLNLKVISFPLHS